MGTTSILQNERDTLVQVQQQILEQMSRQNQIQEDKLQQEDLKALQIKKEIITKIKEAETQELYSIQLEKQNTLEQERIKILTEQTTEIRSLVKLITILIEKQFPQHAQEMNTLHPKVDIIVELLRSIIVPTWPKLVVLLDLSKQSGTQDILVELLKHTTSSGKGDVDVNLGTVIKGDAGDITHAEDNASIH